MIFISHSGILDDKAIIVDIKGVLDSSTSVDFEDYINQLLAKKKSNIIINAENIEYISSAGIGVILYIQKKMIALKGIFIMCNVPDEIMALFKLLGFDKIIRTAEDKAEAIQIMDKQFKLSEEVRKEQIQIKKNDKIVIKQDGNKTETYTPAGSYTEEDYENIFEDPIILECSICKSMIRVRKSGNYICPDCKSEFYVGQDQTVAF